MSAWRGGTLRSRLTRMLVGLGLVSVVLLATVNFFVVRHLLDGGTRGQLETLRSLRAEALEVAVDRVLSRASVLGADPAVAEALRELEAGYVAIDTEVTPEQLDEVRAAYTPVVGRYDDAGADHPPVDELLPASDAGRYVQYEYIAANPNDDRSELVDAGDGTAYSSAHATHHEFLRGLAASAGASDLLLVGVDTGEVVYSTSKRVDLGTNVLHGPYADSGLGIAFDKLGGVAVDDAVIADTSFYLPDSAAPVVHVATAVRDDAEVVGALIVTVPTDRLTDLVNADGEFELLGLGDTGDAYVVGSDLRLRTVPRPWIEDPDAYLDRFLDVTDDERVAGLIEFTGSPVLLQEVDNDAVRTALDGERFVGNVHNYLDEASIAASAPLDVAGLGWVIVTEQHASEARNELERFVITVLVLVGVLVTVLVIVGAVMARVLARPVKPLIEAAGRIADGDYRTDVPDLGRNELGDVGRQLEAVAAQLREQEASIDAEEHRITAMLETVLPAALIDRVRSGERELAEVVDTATVVSISIRGIPAPSVAEQDAVVELTTRLAAETVRLAQAHGVERGQVALEQQIFVAGRGREGTEAAVAAQFAAAVLDTVPAIGAEYGIDLTARAGLSAGLVATGVVGSHQVSFMVWGPPVSDAISLSSHADAGQLIVDDSVVDDLDDDWQITTDADHPDHYAVVRATEPARE